MYRDEVGNEIERHLTPHAAPLHRWLDALRQRAGEGEQTMPSETYRLFERAMEERKQILCTYDGYRRELCPIILGHSQGKEEPSPISSAARADPAYLAGASGAVCFYQVSVRFSFAAEDGMPAIVIRSLHAVSKSSTSMSIPTARTTRNAASVPRLRPLPDEPAPGQRTAVPPPPQSEAKQPIVPLGGNSPAPRAHSVGLRERAGGGT